MPILDRTLHVARLTANRSYVLAYAADGKAVPTDMVLSLDDPARSVRTAHGLDGGVLLVGGNGHPVGRGSAAEHVRELDAWARETFEVGAPQWSWSAQDYRLTTQVPSIGPIPGTKGGLLVAAGCDKWGMANAAAAGHILTGDITGNPPSFVPALRSGLPGVADVVDSAITIAGIGMSWVGARAALAVGGGRVGGGKVAGGNPQTPAHGKGHVEGGPVHPVGVATVDGKTCRVSAVCPHLGGILAWERRRDVVGLPFARFAIRGRWHSCRGSGDQRPDRPRRLPR